MIRAKIDGRDMHVPRGTTVLEAARGLGIDIPTLCHREGMGPSTSCFVCVVKVVGRERLLPACALRVEQDMEVVTDSEELRAARRMALEGSKEMSSTVRAVAIPAPRVAAKAPESPMREASARLTKRTVAALLLCRAKQRRKPDEAERSLLRVTAVRTDLRWPPPWPCSPWPARCMPYRNSPRPPRASHDLRNTGDLRE